MEARSTDYSAPTAPPPPPRSGGTRQALYAAAQAWNDPTIKIVSGFVGDYWEAFRQSKFCLAPHGHGWGIRLLQVGWAPLLLASSCCTAVLMQ